MSEAAWARSGFRKLHRGLTSSSCQSVRPSSSRVSWWSCCALTIRLIRDISDFGSYFSPRCVARYSDISKSCRPCECICIIISSSVSSSALIRFDFERFLPVLVLDLRWAWAEGGVLVNKTRDRLELKGVSSVKSWELSSFPNSYAKGLARDIPSKLVMVLTLLFSSSSLDSASPFQLTSDIFS